MKNELDLAYSNFENVVDPDLIDSCIYQLNAVNMRYKFLLTRVKQLEASLDSKTLCKYSVVPPP
ncbi:YaaL family protein [Lachnospiraceae bacterium ZAX-1]